MLKFPHIISYLTFLVLIITYLLLPEPVIQLPSSFFLSNEIADKPRNIDLKDISLKWNASYRHKQSSKIISDITDTLGSGVCAADFNNDGWVDLFIVGGSGQSRRYGKQSWWSNKPGNRLLINNQGRYFDDRTSLFKLNLYGHGMGCAAVDLNNDGFIDLITTGIGENHIFENIRGKEFNSITNKPSPSDLTWGTGISISDFNKDGMPDIYITNYIQFEKDKNIFERKKGFNQENASNFDPSLYDSQGNFLFLNKGNFVFENISEKLGIENLSGRSLGSLWLDLNQDSWPDLVVINHEVSQNRVFINNKGLNFSDHTGKYNTFNATDTRSILNIPNNNPIGNLLFTQGKGYPTNFLDSMIDHNLSWKLGIARPELLYKESWGAVSADFNNDGFLDIYIANGLSTPSVNSNNSVQAQQNDLLINNNNTSYIPTKTTSNQFPKSSRGVITADLNNDGILEIIVSNNNDNLAILENTQKSNNHWIGFDILSENTTSESIGLKIKISTKDKEITKYFDIKYSFLSQSDNRLIVGLGNNTENVAIDIEWPDGVSVNAKNIAIDQYHLINKDNRKINTISSSPKKNKPRDNIELNNDEKIILLNIFIDSKNHKYLFPLERLWNDGNTDTKLEILERINKNIAISSSQKNNYIVRKALNDEDQEVRIKAISVLETAELESSVSWLIALLGDNDSEISCAASKTLMHFYKEEEAVIHNKNLAIPHLIRVSISQSTKSATCAIDALAEAENKRATQPLIKLLKSPNDNKELVVSIINTLGYIRDTAASNEILKVLKNNPNNPNIAASALITLRRLDHPELKELLKNLEYSKHNSKQRNIENLIITASLLSNNDSVMLDKKSLIANFNTFTKSFDKNEYLISTDEKLFILHAINTNDIDQASIPKYLLTDNDEKVRYIAYLILLKNNLISPNEVINKETFSFIKTLTNEYLLDNGLIAPALANNIIFDLNQCNIKSNPTTAIEKNNICLLKLTDIHTKSNIELIKIINNTDANRFTQEHARISLISKSKDSISKLYKIIDSEHSNSLKFLAMSKLSQTQSSEFKTYLTNFIDNKINTTLLKLHAINLLQNIDTQLADSLIDGNINYD
jgi:HEAT repeat protein